MKPCYILYEICEDNDPPLQDVAVYLSWNEAEHMKKENEKENPDLKFKIIQSLLAEEGDVVL